MNESIYTSLECFSCSKVGGLADVVGSLPKYLKKIGVEASVVIPAYEMPWFDGKLYKIVHQGSFHLGQEHLYFEVRYFIDDILGFPFIPFIFQAKQTDMVCMQVKVVVYFE
ncbi:MAG: glycogen/starch synthase [Saprospiraceae bacterium]|nr:glycogen/starch synthase [Saprospiraceae bacterium]